VKPFQKLQNLPDPREIYLCPDADETADAVENKMLLQALFTLPITDAKQFVICFEVYYRKFKLNSVKEQNENIKMTSQNSK